MSDLQRELWQLFDLKKQASKKEVDLDREVTEAKKDIRHLVTAFSDEIPDLVVPVGESEKLIWDSRGKRLIYVVENVQHMLESVEKQIIVRMRPYLRDLVGLAQAKYV